MTYQEFRNKMIALSKMLDRALCERRRADVVERIKTAIYNLVEENPDFADAI